MAADIDIYEGKNPAADLEQAFSEDKMSEPTDYMSAFGGKIIGPEGGPWSDETFCIMGYDHGFSANIFVRGSCQERPLAVDMELASRANPDSH